MHGLINRAVQCFIRDTYGTTTWSELAQLVDVPATGFEALFVYDDKVTERMIDCAARLLGKPREVLLEDLGTYLVSHPNVEPLRRLLRFGGETFVEFLHSLDDLPRRARLAVPELDLPTLEIIDCSDGQYRLLCQWERDGFGHVLLGVLRTMADDYGALVFLDHEGRSGTEEWISVQILQNAYTEGRPFEIAAGL